MSRKDNEIRNRATEILTLLTLAVGSVNYRRIGVLVLLNQCDYFRFCVRKLGFAALRKTSGLLIGDFANKVH